MHGDVVTTIRAVIEWAALGLEVLAVAIIVASVIMVAVSRGTVRYLFHLDTPGAYETYKHQLAKPLLLALDFLVAGDVVRTIALEPTSIPPETDCGPAPKADLAVPTLVFQPPWS